MKRSPEYLEPFYLLEPQKKTNPSNSLDQDNLSPETFTVFPKLNNEQINQTQTRFEMYTSISETIMKNITNVLYSSHDELFKYLYHFCKVDDADPNPEETSNLIQPSKKLPAGYVLVSSNGINNYRIFQEFFRVVNNDEDLKLVRISAKYSKTIKAIVRQIIWQLDGDDINDDHNKDDDAEEDQDEDQEDQDKERDDQSKYDLQLVREWFASNRYNKLIIVFEDTEAIGVQNINLFFQYIFGIIDLPIKVIFTLATRNISSWINNNINNELRLRLNNYKFETESDANICLNILKQVLTNSPLLLDPKLVQIILSRFSNGNNSIDSVLNEIKLSIMIHFYQNSYSRFINEDPTIEDVQVLKKLPSYKRFVETQLYKYKQSLITKTQVSECFKDDYILDQFNQVKQKYQNVKHQLKKIFKYLHQDELKFYQLLIQGKLFSSQLWQTISQSDNPKLIGHINSMGSVPILFKEVFFINGGDFETETPRLVENYNNLMLSLLRPNSRKTISDNLMSCNAYLNNSLIKKSSKMDPMVVRLFNLLNDAPPTLNHYDFFNAFKHSLDKETVCNELKVNFQDNEWDKVILSWFLHICNEFFMLGLIKEKSRGDHFEKSIWRGL